jgi:hypothetical protein
MTSSVFKITKSIFSKYPEELPDSFISCSFHHIKCGDVIIKELDLLSSEIIYYYKDNIKKLFGSNWVDVFRKNIKKWEPRLGTPELEDEYYVLFEEEIFRKKDR